MTLDKLAVQTGVSRSAIQKQIAGLAVSNYISHPDAKKRGWIVNAKNTEYFGKECKRKMAHWFSYSDRIRPRKGQITGMSVCVRDKPYVQTHSAVEPRFIVAAATVSVTPCYYGSHEESWLYNVKFGIGMEYEPLNTSTKYFI